MMFKLKFPATQYCGQKLYPDAVIHDPRFQELQPESFTWGSVTASEAFNMPLLCFHGDERRT